MPKYAGGRKGGRTDSEKEGGNGLKLVTNLDRIFCFVDLIKILGEPPYVSPSCSMWIEPAQRGKEEREKGSTTLRKSF